MTEPRSPREFLLFLDHGQIFGKWASPTGEYRDGEQIRVAEANGLTLETAEKIAKVLITADGYCYVCAEGLAEGMREVFPEHDWLTLVKTAEGIDDDD